ncbi:MAG TPA: LamG-like jellyroll fold domain-containing protein [Candidatus Dormibacteraeota bacterium]|nr:LamG-like jellyroll fold domain-containing protein [Candidatus Dormibacteraeota bacterium]
MTCVASGTAVEMRGAPILWNRLGSASEVLNSAYGPNLSFYSGGSLPDGTGNPAYVPGVFGNALTIGSGSYTSQEREHTVVWNNLNNYLSPERGTISVWFKQNASPVGFAYGVYRIFDGAYGLGAGIGMDSDAATGTLNFGMDFGGANTTISYNISSYNGTWIHLGGVWDRAGINGSGDKIRLYLNGNVVASSSVGSWGTAVGTQADIGGGNDQDIAGKFAMDNLQVFDTAVTDFSSRFVETIPEPCSAGLVAVGVALFVWTKRNKQEG